ncbi:MAG: TRAP transporter small permease [Thermodesulfobacteriota bacterium]
MWIWLDRLSRGLDRFSRGLMAVMMAVMVLDVLFGVVNRFAFKFSISWTEPLARLLLIWISMIGAAIAVRSGAHIGVLFLVNRLGRYRAPLMLLNAVVVIGFLFIVGCFGLKLSLSQARQYTPALRLSMFWSYLAIPSGCLLMIFHYLAALRRPARIFESQEETAGGIEQW